MNYRKNEVISSKCHALRGVVTYVHWGDNFGRVDLGEKHGGVVDCDFKYHGQHWIWNMDSYPNTPSDSHSAYAFCLHDLVIVLVKSLPLDEQTEEKTKEYTCVAILTEDGTEIAKRYVWPLFRDRDSVVMGAEYTNDVAGNPSEPEDPDLPMEAGFPFVADYDTRELVDPYTDMMGDTRPLGTLVSQYRDNQSLNNTNIVITREGANQYVAHPAIEFMEPGNQFPYVSDIMQNVEPNYKGRIVGFSQDDEVLIDNIPVIKIVDEGEAAEGSIKSTTHKFIHIDEQNNKLTVIFLDMDFELRWWDDHPIDEESGFKPPPWAFYVRTATADTNDLCIYRIMLEGTIPEVTLVPDLDASWEWKDMLDIPEGEQYSSGWDYCEYTFGQNLDQKFGVASVGEDVSLSFWGVDQTYNPSSSYKWSWEEIKFRITTNEDGTYATVKEKGASVHTAHYTGSVSLYANPEDVTNIVYSFYCTAEAMEHVLAEVDGKKLIKRIVASVPFHFRHDYYGDKYPWLKKYDCDSEYYEIYVHQEGDSEWEIARSKIIVNDHVEYFGTEPDIGTQNLTKQIIIFTDIDVRHGIYCFWEFLPADDFDLMDFGITDGVMDNAGLLVWWRHYIKTSSEKTLTKAKVQTVPSGTVSTMDQAQQDSVNGLVELFYGDSLSIYLSTNIYPLAQTLITPDVDGQQKKVDYNWFARWIWDTDSVQAIDGSGDWTSYNARFPEFYHHPFANKKNEWPIFKNCGTPHEGLYTMNSYNPIVHPGAILFSRMYITRTGISYGHGNYSFVYTFPYSVEDNYLVESGELNSMHSCTGRADMNLKLS